MISSKSNPTKNYNHELLQCIEELKSKRKDVYKRIERDEHEKSKVQEQINALTEMLNNIDKSLTRNKQTCNEYDQTITETETAYSKILESSQTLLNVLKRETSFPR